MLCIENCNVGIPIYFRAFGTGRDMGISQNWNGLGTVLLLRLLLLRQFLPNFVVPLSVLHSPHTQFWSCKWNNQLSVAWGGIMAKGTLVGELGGRALG